MKHYPLLVGACLLWITRSDATTGMRSSSSRRTQAAFLAGSALERQRHRSKAHMLAPPSSTRSSTVSAEHVGLRGLYPPSRAFSNGTLQVDDIHTLYYEEHGKKSPALHALFLHGGPGAGCFPNHARFFDPDLYHIVLLDQRGAGRSTPSGEFRQNTLLHLVEDCETLRKHLNIRRWDVVLGGSWGVTLAVAYAQSYPDSVRSLVLRGVCLLRTREVDWLFSANGGAALRLNPTGWKEFEQASVATNNHASTISTPRDALHGYYDRLLGADSAARFAAARSWMRWEYSVYAHRTSSNPSNQGDFYEKAYAPVAVSSGGGEWSYQDGSGHPLSEARIQQLGMESDCKSAVENRRQGLPVYVVDPKTPPPTVARPVRTIVESTNGTGLSPETTDYIPAQNLLTCFYSTNERYAMNNLELLSADRMSRIQNIPCIAVQGGEDPICPVDTALDLSAVWQSMELRIPLKSGHSMYDVAIANELVRATDRMATRLLDTGHTNVL
jgi:proline iminopeptidase